MQLLDEGGQVLPEFINKALANYLPMVSGLCGELERLRLYNTKLTRDYQNWFDARYVETRQKLVNDGTRTKSNPPSQLEITAQLKVDYTEKYNEWMDHTEVSNAKISYLASMQSFLKKFDQILVSLANNSRSEMYSLSTQNRMSKEEEPRRRSRTLKETN